MYVGQGEDLLLSPTSGCCQYLNCALDGCLVAWIQWGFLNLKKKEQLQNRCFGLVHHSEKSCELFVSSL